MGKVDVWVKIEMTMKKIALIIVLLASCIKGVEGQQIPYYKQYNVNSYLYNPALAGNGADMNVYLLHNTQWSKLPGSPLTSSMTFDGPILKNVNGVGFFVYNDQTGIFNRTGLNGSYAHHFHFTEKINLSVGASFGIVDNKIDFTKAIVIQSNEPYLFNTTQNKTLLKGAIGLSFNWDKLDIGLSVPQIGGQRLVYEDNKYLANYTEVMHYLATVKYKFILSEEKDLTAYPLILIRFIENGPVQYDINGVVDFQNRIWAGLAYRSNYAFSLSAGIKLYDFLTLGYSYDFVTNSIRTHGGSSSEILIGISIRNNKDKKEMQLVDSDKDGVADEFDLEPNTPLGTLVNFQGKTIPLYNAETNVVQTVDTTLINEGDTTLINNVTNNYSSTEEQVFETSVFFDYDDAKVKEGNEDKFVMITKLLKQNPEFKITLIGNTDSRGSMAYNLNLSQKRAQAVANSLMIDFGVSAERINVVIAKGKEEILSNTKHVINRRVDIIVK
jgi:type IX secretion system PorP/SprF family membrane protein